MLISERVHLALNSEWATYRWGSVSPQARDPVFWMKTVTCLGPLSSLTHMPRWRTLKSTESPQIDKAQAAGIHISHLDAHMETLFCTADLLNVYLNLGRDYKLPVLLERDQNLHGLQVASAVALFNRHLQIK